LPQDQEGARAAARLILHTILYCTRQDTFNTQRIRISSMKTKFSDRDLEHIVEQGMIFMCACPAQVAGAMQQLRQLVAYQMRCISDPDNNIEVHQQIADSTIKAHRELEACLTKVIALEHWDPVTLDMPEGLRKRQLDEANDQDQA